MEYFVVDAFTTELFAGNPAGVCFTDGKLADSLMQSIASENNLPETAFVSGNGDAFNLRWFTPEKEIDLCGHATLATAYILHRFMTPDRETYLFNTMSGELVVTVKGDLLELDFPSRPPRKVEATPEMSKAIGAPVLEAYRSRDLIMLTDSAEMVCSLTPDMTLLAALPDAFGVVVTAPGEGDEDFVSRFFAPGAGIPEDPVTGSSHTSLIPFWAARLKKTVLTAKQLSKRGGTLYCRDAGSRVMIAGYARLYMWGNIEVNSTGAAEASV